MSDAMIIYAAETGAIVKLLCFAVALLSILLLGILMVNFRLRARCARMQRAYAGLLKKLAVSKTECARLAEIRRRTDIALIKLKGAA